MREQNNLIILEMFGFTRLHQVSDEQLLSGRVEVALHDPLDGIYQTWAVAPDYMHKFVSLLFEYTGETNRDVPTFNLCHEQQCKMVGSLKGSPGECVEVDDE